MNNTTTCLLQRQTLQIDTKLKNKTIVLDNNIYCMTFKLYYFSFFSKYMYN